MVQVAGFAGRQAWFVWMGGCGARRTQHLDFGLMEVIYVGTEGLPHDDRWF